MSDPDFSKCHLDVNLKGSWRRVITFDAVRDEEVKAAALTLYRCSVGRLTFRIADAVGGVIEHLGPVKPIGHGEWRAR